MSDSQISRRAFLGSAAIGAVSVASPTVARAAHSQSFRDRATISVFAELDDKVQTAMAKYGVPGAAVGVVHGGQHHIRCFGVTNVDYPVPIDPDTVFRIASTTKTFTGTAAMRLVDQGNLDLEAKVRRYLPHFRTHVPGVAERVTVRQLLDHTAGWLGDDFENTGQGDDALARYVAGMARLPQLTAPGAVFSYSNSALSLAGRVIEAATKTTYEHAVRELLLDPLGLSHTRFFSDEIIGFNIAAPHILVDGKPVVDPSAWPIERAGNANGGLISSIRDQLAWARFHLGDGRARDGRRLMSKRSLVAMRSHPGPGGTLIVELEGMGVSWMLRPSAQRVRIVQHGGDVPGERSGFMLVPSRGFGLTVLTNSDGGTRLLGELFADDWALRRFAGLTNLPAVRRRLTPRQLAPFEGRYVSQELDPKGNLTESSIEMSAHQGELLVKTPTGATISRLAFYRSDHVIKLDADGSPSGFRADFLRGPDRRVKWVRIGGRLFRHAG
jgi:CubicO group peptidase (beta-lactamase class C family)